MARVSLILSASYRVIKSQIGLLPPGFERTWVHNLLILDPKLDCHDTHLQLHPHWASLIPTCVVPLPERREDLSRETEIYFSR
jgi:hypothetical protein